MPISIKNEQTEELARKVAEFTGETLTEAIRVALTERYERLLRARAVNSRLKEMTEIALRCARRPLISQMSDDEILGYDEFGVPTR